jgi:hypothetical protein
MRETNELGLKMDAVLLNLEMMESISDEVIQFVSVVFRE